MFSGFRSRCRTANSSYHFLNLIGLNNAGQVLGDDCVNGTGCVGVDRFPGVWTNGVINPLPIPAGYSYIASLEYYAINDSGMVVGTLQVTGTNTSHVVVWTNGVPAVLPDAPIPGEGSTCSTSGSSSSFGLTAAGHIVGSTSYPSTQPGGQGCSGYWVYNGATFRVLPVPIPAQCAQLPPRLLPRSSSGLRGRH